jgi:hypothetical protein
MDIINEYKNRFYNLLESTMGDVRPLITEDETVKGSPEFNQIVTNLGLDLEKLDEYNYNIKNGNQLFGGNGSNYSLFFKDNIGDINIDKIDSKLPNNNLKDEGVPFIIRNLNNTTKIETIKTIVQSVVNGKLDKNLVTKEHDVNHPKFYEFYETNTLEGYDGYLNYLIIDLEGGNQIKDIYPSLFFKSKNPENRVKAIDVDYNGVKVSYGGGLFKKEYVLDGNKISFEKDRKSTKTTGKYTKIFDTGRGTTELNILDLKYSDKYVKYGMKGDIVRQIQSALLRSGQLTTAFQLAKDNEACKQDYKQCHGTFGPKTYAAVKEFQAANDLVEDGIVGPDTAEALYGV